MMTATMLSTFFTNAESIIDTAIEPSMILFALHPLCPLILYYYLIEGIFSSEECQNIY